MGSMHGYDPTIRPEFHDLRIGHTPHPPLLPVARLAALEVRAKMQNDLRRWPTGPSLSPNLDQQMVRNGSNRLGTTSQTPLKHTLRLVSHAPQQ